LEVLANDVLTCDQLEVDLIANDLANLGGPYSYLWSGPDIDVSNEAQNGPSITVAGDYFVTVTHEASGCMAEGQVNIQALQDPPGLSTMQFGALGCGPDSVLLAATVSGSTNFEGVWNGPQILSDPNELGVWVGEAGTYWFEVIDEQSGCTNSDTLEVSPAEAVEFALDLHPVCPDEQNGAITIVPASGLAPYTYILDGNTMQDTSVFSGLSPGTYLVEVVDANGCVGVQSITLETFPAISLSLEEQHDFCGAEGVELDLPLPVDSSQVTINWSDGQMGPIFYSDQAGMYSVTVVSPCQVESADFELVDLAEGEGEVQIPNIFTPDGDGVNDQFKVLFEGTILDYEMRIFNRWGQEVFSSSDPDQGWDGNRAGNSFPMDTYVWKLSMQLEGCAGPIQVERSGEVTLLR
jgi:gliding motility-associated-like protein